MTVHARAVRRAGVGRPAAARAAGACAVCGVGGRVGMVVEAARAALLRRLGVEGRQLVQGLDQWARPLSNVILSRSVAAITGDSESPNGGSNPSEKTEFSCFQDVLLSCFLCGAVGGAARASSPSPKLARSPLLKYHGAHPRSGQGIPSIRTLRTRVRGTLGDHLAAMIQELTTLSPYLGSPEGTEPSWSHPPRGREADLARGRSRTILLALASRAG